MDRALPLTPAAALRRSVAAAAAALGRSVLPLATAAAALGRGRRGLTPSLSSPRQRHKHLYSPVYLHLRAGAGTRAVVVAHRDF